MEEYENVLDVVKRGGNWALYTMLTGIHVLNRAERIKEVFRTACNENDDKSALQYFSWFLKAVDDENLLYLVSEDGDSKGLPYSDEVKKAKLNAQATKTRMTMELYNELPTYGVGQAREFIAEDETKLVNVDIPVLLKTKRAMLTEVAEWWGTTKNEKEADKILDFLCQVPTPFEEEEKMRLDVIRKATHLNFPVPRLTRQFLSLAPPAEGFYDERSKRNIARILAIARTRNKDEKLFQELMVMQYLQGCSEGAFQFLENIAKQLAIFDAEIRELKEMMQPTGEIGFPGVYGEIQMSYSDINSLTVFIKQIRLTNIPLESEKKLYKQKFEVAQKIVLQWRKEHSKRNVKLVLIVKEESTDESSKPIFSMNRTF